ncbi:hypothetical protein VBH15_04835 [Vagococcus fluvialis]|uniref:hypothetical protein n=1 Tax=Vagococcus fluvialis TaxID=2738 RepID=UPI0037D65045
MNILVLKTSEENLLTIEDIKEQVQGDWKFNPSRLPQVDAVIVLNKGTVIAEFELGNEVKYFLDEKRVRLQLNEIKVSTGLLNREISYNTQNPATLSTLKDLRSKVL